ncbi:MAG: cation diffusion facilitator family transporter [Anaerovoracaceae bacterium]|jgi:cation diffusion facilitator family transporter
MHREKRIIRTSIIGIAANVLLAAFKAVIGTLTHSVAITLDAVNNLSDALSSLITIIGTRLAAKEPDKKHPLGYGRVEYLSAAVISVIILYAGISSLVESIKKILHPTVPDYSTIALVIIAVAVGVKIALGLYVQKQGRETDSGALIASGKDAMFDSIISASTLAAAAVYLLSGIRLEAWLGAVIAVVIIKAGLDSLIETISEILGERLDPALSRAVKETIAGFPEVLGVYDLIINNYGPSRRIGSVHVELPDDMNVYDLDDLEYRIVQKVFHEHRVVLTGISVYAMHSQDPEEAKMRDSILEITGRHKEVIETHGFHLDRENRVIRFDIIVDFNLRGHETRQQIYDRVVREVQQRYPDYTLQVILDYDVSD